MALFVFQSIGAAWKRTNEKEKKKVPSPLDQERLLQKHEITESYGERWIEKA